MGNLQVSVLTPVYNGEKHLQEMVDSILRQTLQDFEFIIINDGSTDGTEEIIKSYNDPRIRYFSNDKNRGIAYSFNRAIDLANGNFLAVAEADDVSHPRRLEIQAAYMQANKNVGFVCSKQRIFRDATVQFAKITAPQRITHSAKQNKHGTVFYSTGVRHASAMYRARTLNEHNVRYNPDYKIAGDHYIFTTLTSITAMVCLDCTLLHYRIHENNYSRNMVETSREANAVYRKFFQKEFNFTMQGELVLGSEQISPANFVKHIAMINHILAHTSKHPNYDQDLLVEAAAIRGYKSLKAVMKSGIGNKQAFHLYQKNQLLHHISNSKKIKLWVKYFTWHLGIKR